MQIKRKKPFEVKCPDCNKIIIGFSEHHAKQNLKIHQAVSKRCKDIKVILKTKMKEAKK